MMGRNCFLESALIHTEKPLIGKIMSAQYLETDTGSQK